MQSECDEMQWFHGKISREIAEQLLKDTSQGNGTFLIRESNTASGDYVLSVVYDNDVVHYQIRKHGEDAFFSIEERATIHGLDTLVEYYQEDGHGIVTKLTKPCKGDAPPHDSRRHGRTNLLHRATKEGNYTVVSELLKCGYRSLEAKNEEGQTAVHLASRMGKTDILRKLIESGANINCRDTAGYTPLHYACQSNLPNTVQLLILEGGANVQARNPNTSWVALHEAASRGLCEVVRTLLALNAPVRPRTSDNNQTPEDLAVQNNHVECARLLRNFQRPAAKTTRDSWYHGTLNRSEAKSILNDQPDGSFLIRYSDRNGAHVLTMIYDKVTYNFIIKKKGDLLYIDDGPYLESLEHIVEHYRVMTDGLPTTLQYPVPPKPKPPLPEFSTMPRPNRLKRREIHASSPPISTCEPPKPSPALIIDSKLQEMSILDMDLKNSNIPCMKTSKIQPDTSRKFADNSIYSEFIPSEHLHLEKIIGEGEFGYVYKGIYSPGNQVVSVAIKTLHQDNVENDRNSFLREAKVMAQLNHPCIVRLIGLSNGTSLMMIEEFVELGSLLNYLKTNAHDIDIDFDLKLWAAQIANGMVYLETQQFVHRDLAARNILLANRYQAKISDFGLSRALGTSEYYRAQQGGKWPVRWYAPESYNFGTFSHASDVWSYGVLLWEMYSFGQQPYGDLKGVQVIALIDKGERLLQPEKCPDNVYELMQQCWKHDPLLRPNFSSLIEFFNPDYENVRELISANVCS